MGRVGRVWRRQIGVSSCRGGCHSCCHGDSKRSIGDRVVGRGVSKSGRCGGVMDTWVREAGVRQGGEGGERTV